MSARVLLGSTFVFLAAVPVLAGLSRTTGSHATLAEAFALPQPLSTPIRLERTPRMDGVYRPEEWDLLWRQEPPARPALPLSPVTMRPPNPVLAPAPPASVPDAGIILSGAIGPLATPVAPPQTVATEPGRVKPPSSTPIGQVPPASAKPPVSPQAGSARSGTAKDGTAPLAPVNIQPINPKAMAPAPPPIPAQAAFMSWEPGKLYFAGFVAPGNDMLVSIDGSNNGFLLGKDNLELRVTPGVVPTVKARILDGTAPTPVWIDASGFEMACVVASAPQPDGSVFVELAVTDPGYGIIRTGLKDTVGLRVDAVPTASPVTDAAMPRVMSQVQLADQRVTDLPDGLRAAVAAKGRSVVAGGATTVKWQLTGNDSAGVKYVEISGEGGLGDKVNLLRVPSPEFDSHGRSIIDYPTRVLPSAAAGYGVLKGELTGAGWVGGAIESSIRVAPTFDIVAPAKKVKPSPKLLRLTCTADIVLNSDQRLEGNFRVVPPRGWRVDAGTDRTFYIYDKGAKANRQFILDVPAGVHGTFEAKIRVVAFGTVTEQPYWITIL